MVHAFLDFELDEERFELRSRGELIATQRRVFAMISYLLHARDRVVGRAELMRALWNGTVVSETAISQVIMLARKALRDEGESQRVIRTVRGRGFRFVAAVESRPGKSLPPAPSGVTPAAAAATRPPLLGRGAEMRALLEHLAQAERGAGGLVLIEGEPGIGKTTMAEELAAHALERGFEVIWGRAWEEDGAPPFWPWIQVLRGLLQAQPAELLRAELGASAAELAGLLPELFESRREQPELPGPLPRVDAADVPRARFRQFDAIARVLRQYSRRNAGAALGAQPRPARLVILDDLHAADDASVQLTRFLMPELRELGLLLLGTYRDLECARRSALAALAESCADNTLRLTGLAPAEVSELLARKLGAASPARWAGALHGLSAGNPLLLSTLCTHLDADDPEPLLEFSQLESFALPERIASAVRRHLAELPEGTRAALTSASALGREFPLPLLSALHGCSEPELLETLAPALRRGVLRPAPNAAGRLIFSHALVRSTVYAELSPQLRLELHRRIGELLERSAPPGRLPLHELARHFFLASADGCRHKALEYTRLAAAQALSVMAYETAASLYERALQLLALEQAGSDAWHELLCSAGDAWYRSGDLEHAARFERAVELARAEQDPERFAWAVVGCAGALRGTLLHDHKRQEQFREALAMLPPGESEIKALVLCGSTLSMGSADSLAERDATTRDAVEMARRIGDDRVLYWTLNARHYVLWGGAPPARLIPIASEMIELARKLQEPEPELVLDALLWRLTDYGELGDIAAVLRDRQEYRDQVERFGTPWHRYMALGFDTLEAATTGDFSRARELSDHTLQLGLRMQESLTETFHALRALFLDFQQGLLGAARGATRAAPPAYLPSDYRAFWALAWAVRGELSPARELLEEVLARERGQRLLDALRRPTLTVMAYVSVLLQERAASAQLYQALAPLAGLQVHMQAWVYLGPIDYYLGELARSLGERRAAAQHFERAIAQCVIARPFAARAQCAYGQLLAEERGTLAQADQLLRAAQQGAALLGMTELHAQASAALAAAGALESARPIEQGAAKSQRKLQQ